jgi:hypothetical protein
VPEPDNPVDADAVLILTHADRKIGWVPAYLTRLVHRMAHEGTPAPRATVERIGDRRSPVHLRLLCRFDAPWPVGEPVFAGPDYDVLGEEFVASSG